MSPRWAWLISGVVAASLAAGAAAEDLWLVGQGEELRIQDEPHEGVQRSFSRVAISSTAVVVTHRRQDRSGSAVSYGAPIVVYRVPGYRDHGSYYRRDYHERGHYGYTRRYRRHDFGLSYGYGRRHHGRSFGHHRGHHGGHSRHFRGGHSSGRGHFGQVRRHHGH